MLGATKAAATTRVLFGQYDTLLNELRIEERGGFKAFLRIDTDVFAQILGRVSHRIQKSIYIQNMRGAEICLH